MTIIISKTSNQPIYEQIVTQLKQAIIQNELSPGDPLQSIRQMAKNLSISVITTKRAYEELEKAGYVYSIVGKGTFVAEQSPELLQQVILSQIEDHLLQAIDDSKTLQLSLTDLQEMLSVLYKEDH